MLEIITIPNPILYRKSVEITDLDFAIGLGEEMLKAMEKYGGCGLSAPQIGQNVNLFVLSKMAQH